MSISSEHPGALGRTDEDRVGRALRAAQGFLRRYTDAFTRAEVDDLAQEAACAAWRWSSAVRDGARFPAAVVTITRRVRARAMREHLRRRGELERCAGAGARAEEPRLRIGGRFVPLAWALSRLPKALAALPPADRMLLLAYYEGFCCAELAERFDRTEETVKVRIHRARRRLQLEIEHEVRAAAALDGFEPT